MALSRAEIQKRSNEKHGRCTKTYALDEETVALIDRLAKAQQISKGALIAAMAREYAQKHGL